jgi:hypothetical protein
MVGFQVEGYESPEQAAVRLADSKVNPVVVLLSRVGGGDPDRDIPFLRSVRHDIPIVVELDGDDPKAAFAMLRLRAYNVVSNKIFNVGELCDILIRAIGNSPAYPPQYGNPERPQPNWGFTSMTFKPGSQDNADFNLAIRPTARVLRLGIERCDEIASERASDLRIRIQKAILQRSVLVAQLSTCTLNTMYEIGFADARKKTIIFLLRRPSPLPAVLQGVAYLEYSTWTELAMKLFYGLGGNENDLRSP